MKQARQFASLAPSRPAMSFLVLAFLVWSAMAHTLEAQNSLVSFAPAGYAALPDNPAYGAALTNPMAANTLQGSRPIFDPFKPRPRFGISTGSPETGFEGSAAAGLGFSTRRAGSWKRLGSADLAGHQGNLAAFFPIRAFEVGSVGGIGPLSAPAGTLPTLNQLMRANLHAPLGLPSADFSSSYQQRFGSIGNSVAPDFSQLLATGIYTSSNLGNGMIFSAGAGSGSRTMAGAPTAFLANGTTAPRHSTPAVAFKLSF